MKKLHTILPGIALALAAGKTSAQLVYEPFDYGSAATSGAAANFSNLTGAPAFEGYANPMNGQSWFSATNTASVDPMIYAGSAGPVAGLAPNYGDQGGSDSYKTSKTPRLGIFPVGSGFTAAGSTLYYSMVLKLTDFGTLPTSGFFVGGFNNSVGTQGGNTGVVGTKLFVRLDAADSTRYNIGVGPNGSVPPIYASQQFALNEEVFVVGSYTIVDGLGGTNDIQKLWINPDSSTFGGGSAPTTGTVLTAPSGTGSDVTAALLSFVFRTANVASSPSGIRFDEVRVDQTWAQVTPPSGSLFTGASSSDWSNSGAWDAGGVPGGAAKFAYFTGGGGSVNVDSPQTVGTLTFRSPNAYSISGDALTFNGDSGGASAINVQPQMDAAGPNIALPASHTIATPLTLNNTLAVNVGASQSLTISGDISASGAGIDLEKSGPGLLALSGTNSYTGGTTIRGGVLRAVDAASLPAGNLNLRGGVIEIGSGSFTRAIGNAANQVQFTGHGNGGPGGFSAVGAPLVVDLGGDGTGTGPLIAWGGSGILSTNFILNAYSATADLDFKNPINLSINTPSSRNISVNAHSATLSGVISNSGTGSQALTKSGAGTLVLAAANTFGGFRVDGGAVAVSSDANLGAVPVSEAHRLITLNGGTLRFTESMGMSSFRGLEIIDGTTGTLEVDTGKSVSFGGPIHGPNAASFGGRLVKAGNGELTLGGAGNTFMGLAVTGGTLTIINESQFGTSPPTPAQDNINLDGGTLKISTSFTPNGNRGITVGAGGGGFNTNGFAVGFAQPIVGAGTLTKSGGGLLQASALQTGGLVINAGTVAVTPSGGAASGTSVIPTLTINAGNLDLTDNKLVTATALGSWNGSNYDGVTGMVRSGLAGGAWNGNGIVTSQSDASGVVRLTTLAVANAGDVGYGGTKTFGGETVAPTDTLVMYTYAGDANLSGDIDGDDYAAIDAGFSAQSTGYAKGDFDLSGKIDADDYFLIDLNYARQGAAFPTAAPVAGVTAVPEPAGLSLLVAAAALLGRRRRAISSAG